jgi:biopolymer transport protein ExbD
MSRSRRLFSRQEASLVGLDVGALAPMVDMMTLLLVFLLRSYSNEAAPTPPSGPFELAGTQAEGSRQGGTQVMLSVEAVFLDGERVLAVDYLGSEPMIRPLYDRLLGVRDKSRLEVISDKHVPYGTLKKVFQTARSAGFSKITLVGASSGSL